MPFQQSSNPNLEPSINSKLQDTNLRTTVSVLFTTSDPIRELLDTSASNDVSLVIDTLDTSQGFPKLDIQLSPKFNSYVY